MFGEVIGEFCLARSAKVSEEVRPRMDAGTSLDNALQMRGRKKRNR